MGSLLTQEGANCKGRVMRQVLFNQITGIHIAPRRYNENQDEVSVASCVGNHPGISLPPDLISHPDMAKVVGRGEKEKVLLKGSERQ